MKRSIFTNLCIGATAIMLVSACKTTSKSEMEEMNPPLKKGKTAKVSALTCTAPAEQTDYNVYKLTTDAMRIGDVMPYYDSATSQFHIYFLKDIWNDATQKRHPWYGYKTSNFYSYTALSAGEILSSSSNGCAQDYAIGTGNVVKKGSVFYAFYTGHNPNYPSSCVTHKEGVMLATSSSLNSNFTKNTSFATIYPPTGLNYDQGDNFRDPYVFWDSATAKYYMLISARKDVGGGNWKGVIAYYTSTNITNWTYQGVLYDGGTDNFFMMETAEIFKTGSTYYLLFSDINTKHVYYRKNSSITGAWSKPTGADRFEGNGIYAAKTAIDGFGDRYIFGWTNAQNGNSDSGTPTWGGNLVSHKVFQKANGDLAVAIPHTLKSYLETQNHPISVNSQWGNVTNTIQGTKSYNLVSSADFDVANVIFEPVNLHRFKISATVSYASSAKDFGFMIGACDGYNDFYSLRFVPSQNRFALEKVSRSAITTSTAVTDVPFNLSPNNSYNIQIVIENSMLIVYLNNEVALSTRVYKATNTSWGVFADNSNATFNNITVTKP